MTTPLPDAPDLEQLKKQAKDLLSAHRTRDPEAALRVQRALPGLAETPLESVLRRTLILAEAQLIIAREHGFPSWPRLKKHVSAVAPDPAEQFKAAVESGDAGRVRTLLRRRPRLRQQINAPLFSFDAPAVCIAKNNRALMDVLLDYGADINARSQWWAGGFGVLDGAQPESSEYLIERGAYVDAHAASSLGMIGRLQELVTTHPEVVHARGGDGQTPLHVARTPEVAAFLLDSGADLEARDIDHGSTPAQYAVAERPDVCRLLLSRGARDDIFLRCALGDLAEVRAMVSADRTLLRSLTTRGAHAPVAAPGEHIYNYTLGGQATPLMVAAGRDIQTVAALLLELGADINGRDAIGTALHAAAWGGHVAMIRFLLARGADRNCRDTLYHATPAGWAAHGGQVAAKEALLEDAGIVDAAAFGLPDRVRALLAADPPPAESDLRAALAAAEAKGDDEMASLLRHSVPA